MPSTRTPGLKVVGAVVVGNGTWPTRFVRSQSRAKRIVQNILARSTALGSPFTPVVAPVLSDGTALGASAAAAKTWLQGKSIKNLKGQHVTSLIGKNLKT